MAMDCTLAFTFLALFGVANLSIGLAENPEETGDYMEGDIVSVAPSLLLGTSRAGILGDRYRWPNATVPYQFQSHYPSSLRALFLRATQHISEKTCIKFIPRTNEADHIFVMSGRGCYSHVGRIGGRQDVSLPRNCYNIGTFIHELIHALGFHHEQSRTDRDDYVVIKYENIRPGMAFNFDKAKMVSPFGVSYDYGSVMHYSKSAFSRDGRDTIVPKKPATEIGQRRGMSASDTTKINNMYCNKNQRNGKQNDGSQQQQEERPLKLF